MHILINVQCILKSSLSFISKHRVISKLLLCIKNIHDVIFITYWKTIHSVISKWSRIVFRKHSSGTFLFLAHRLGSLQFQEKVRFLMCKFIYYYLRKYLLEMFFLFCLFNFFQNPLKMFDECLIFLCIKIYFIMHSKKLVHRELKRVRHTLKSCSSCISRNVHSIIQKFLSCNKNCMSCISKIF